MMYTTAQGDTWDMIAYKMLGKEALMVQIMLLNPDHISTSIFSAGTKLILPEITVTEELYADLPPWKV